MFIMIAGPYRGTTPNPQDWKENHDKMNQVAYEVFKKGHIPIIGVNLALPIINIMGRNTFNELMMPISLAAAERCDAILRIGGASKGADQEVEIFKKKGLPVYYSINDIK